MDIFFGYTIDNMSEIEVDGMKKYRKRIADEILARKLEGKGAVLIEGPKWCGKTTTAEQIASSILYMDEPEKKEQNIAMSELNPKRLLKGATPRLIDEWQIAPKLWDAIRFEVDHRGELGQFVLTGSAVPADTKEITHSGTGRFTWLTMRPMSLYESGDSSGEVSLKTLFDGVTEIDGASDLDIDRLAFLVCRGGWPQAVDMRDEIAWIRPWITMMRWCALILTGQMMCRRIRKKCVGLCVPMPEIREAKCRIPYLHRMYLPMMKLS